MMLMDTTRCERPSAQHNILGTDGLPRDQEKIPKANETGVLVESCIALQVTKTYDHGSWCSVGLGCPNEAFVPRFLQTSNAVQRHKLRRSSTGVPEAMPTSFRHVNRVAR